MIRGHVIALDPTEAQAEYFRRAAGTARYAWNWALAEWKRQYAEGERPNAAKLKAAWNVHRKRGLPWSFEVTKCASAQSIRDLGAAFANFFRDLGKPKGARRSGYPRFKKKRLDEGFALWNDQFAIKDKRIRIPHLGWVRMREALRFAGVIAGARIAFVGGRWCASVQVEDGFADPAPKAGGTVVGIDLGVTTLATLSTGEKIAGPKARKRLLGRVKRLQRRISLQKHRGKKAPNRQWVRKLRR